VVAGGGTVEVALGDGTPLAVLSAAGTTADVYAYAEVTAEFGTVHGVHDVRLRLRGAVRLAHVGFEG
jgi:beta-glucosidase